MWRSPMRAYPLEVERGPNQPVHILFKRIDFNLNRAWTNPI
jgi:hypothetical protein